MQSTKQKSAKSKPRKQPNVNQIKPKNKQPASLLKKRQLHMKTSPNSRESRKVGNTANLSPDLSRAHTQSDQFKMQDNTEGRNKRHGNAPFNSKAVWLFACPSTVAVLPYVSSGQVG